MGKLLFELPQSFILETIHSDTPISHFWPFSKAFPNTVKCSTSNDVFLVVLGLSSWILWLKGTDRALYFFCKHEIENRVHFL